MTNKFDYEQFFKDKRGEYLNEIIDILNREDDLVKRANILLEFNEAEKDLRYKIENSGHKLSCSIRKDLLAKLDAFVVLKNQAEMDFDKWIAGILIESKGQKDKYGVPISHSVGDITFDEKEVEELRADIKKGMIDDKDIGQYIKDNNVSDKEIDEEINKHMKALPYIVDLVLKYDGEKYQNLIRPGVEVAYSSLLRISKRKGRRFWLESNNDMIDELEKVYWIRNGQPNYPMSKYDNGVEFRHNRQTYFEYLASKYKKSNGKCYSFKGIEAFEKAQRPKWFTPPKAKK